VAYKNLIFICWLFSVPALAQQRFNFTAETGNAQEPLPKKLNYKTVVTDSLFVYQEAEKVISQLQFKGFLLAEIKTITFNNNNAVAIINLNKLYKLAWLSAGNLPETAIRAIGFKEKEFKNIAFNPLQLTQLFNSLLTYLDNTGYPFASLSLDSIAIVNQEITAKIKANLNQKFTYDTLVLVGNAKTSQKYLQSYLNIYPNQVYKEATVVNVASRLKELTFVTVVKPPEINFLVDKAQVNIFLNKKNGNQFDGILGLLPNATTNKLQLIGNVKLRLLNAFNKAELIDFNYQGFAEKSQSLLLSAKIPQFLNTPFTLNTSLNLLKQDTSFLNLNARLGFTYVINGNNSFQFFVDHRSSSLVSSNQYKNISTLPQILDANTTFYGLGFVFEQLDYRFNPQKGLQILADVSIGAKNIKKNSAIASALYNNINLNSTSYKLQSKINWYVPLANQFVLAIINENGIIKDNNLLNNELFRLGGLNSLRGFNELSFFASSYAMLNIETRYRLAQNSFLFTFYNQAYVQQKTLQINVTDYPLGFGAGINLETGIGITTISYALGKQKNNPLNLQQGKIHFGIIALF
jgi:hypothetical protein